MPLSRLATCNTNSSAYLSSFSSLFYGALSEVGIALLSGSAYVWTDGCREDPSCLAALGILATNHDANGTSASVDRVCLSSAAVPASILFALGLAVLVLSVVPPCLFVILSFKRGMRESSSTPGGGPDKKSIEYGTLGYEG